MPRIHFLSQFNMGSRMGMGHYERLLISHLMDASSRSEWHFGFTCAGRPDKEKWEAQHSGFETLDSFGMSDMRLIKWPYSVVRSLTNARFSRLGHTFGGGTHKFEQPDVYHSFALNFAPPTSRPSIYTIHDLPPLHFSDEGRLSTWAKSAARNATLILTPSEFGKREVVNLLDVEPDRVCVVPNGCEIERFNSKVLPASPEKLKELGIDGPFLIYVGGAAQRKHVPALLEAWRALSSRHSELQLVLVGPSSLKQMANSKNVPRVIATDYLSRDILPSVLKAAKALVCPSIYEGFGLPPLEAMALGVPAVGTMAGGAVPEVIGDAGVLAEDGSAEAIAESVEELLGNPELELYLRQVGPRRAQQFSWKEHARTVLNLYRHIANSGTATCANISHSQNFNYSPERYKAQLN